MTLPENFDKNKCPNCKQPTAMDRPKAHHLGMVCANCKYTYTDEEAEATLGVRKVETVDHNGDNITAFINVGNGHELFHSWYCLKSFKTYDDMVNHDRKYHKVGDPMAGCIPSGYILDMDIKCGDEMVV